MSPLDLWESRLDSNNEPTWAPSLALGPCSQWGLRQLEGRAGATLGGWGCDPALGSVALAPVALLGGGRVMG